MIATFILTRVAGGELFERVIDEDFELTEAACIKYMRQICDGVEFMKRSQVSGKVKCVCY